MAIKSCQEGENVVNENSTLTVKYQLLGKDGVTPVTLDGGDVMEMVLHDETTQTVINGHGDPDPTDVTSEVDGSGIWTHEFDGDDNPVVTSTNKQEIHICTVKITKAGTSGFDLTDDFEIKVIRKPFAF